MHSFHSFTYMVGKTSETEPSAVSSGYSTLFKPRKPPAPKPPVAPRNKGVNEECCRLEDIFCNYNMITLAAAAAKSLQSCTTLCDAIDGSPPGFPVPGILQARTLEWVAISFSNV